MGICDNGSSEGTVVLRFDDIFGKNILISVLSDTKCGIIKIKNKLSCISDNLSRFIKQKKPPKGLFGTHCAVGQADDLDESLFELVV